MRLQQAPNVSTSRPLANMCVETSVDLRRVLHRFRYLTPRIRLTPTDLRGTRLENPSTLHFICSPARASTIMQEILAVPDWRPLTLFEPIPVCA